MPPAPDDLPESIIAGQFTGLRNTIERERLQLGELEVAINVDLDDAGQLRRRRGKTRAMTGNCHSLWSSPSGRTLMVRDGTLGVLRPSYAFAPVSTVGPNPVAFTEVGSTIYYSSRDMSGKVLSDDAWAPWGAQDGSARWVSPVIRPTETLGAISGRRLTAPPNATVLESWNGRIYMADGPVVWATEAFQFDYIDRTRNFLQFETDVTVMLALDTGIYVGTDDGLSFLTGTFGKGMSRKTLSASPVLRGSGVRVPAEDIPVTAGPARVGTAVILLTTTGALACFEGGEVVNLTSGKVEFPAAQSAAALHRRDSGVSSYLAATDNGGDRMANARVGDFVDAEIIRFQGG